MTCLRRIDPFLCRDAYLLKAGMVATFSELFFRSGLQGMDLAESHRAACCDSTLKFSFLTGLNN